MDINISELKRLSPGDALTLAALLQALADGDTNHLYRDWYITEQKEGLMAEGALRSRQAAAFALGHVKADALPEVVYFLMPHSGDLVEVPRCTYCEEPSDPEKKAENLPFCSRSCADLYIEERENANI